MNLSTFLIAAVLCALAALIIRKLLRDRQSGKTCSSCGGCSGCCPGCNGSCSSKKT